MSYLGKFLQSPQKYMGNCESWPLQNVNRPGTTQMKTYVIGLKLIKHNASMAFYNAKEQLHLETDAFSVELCTSLLQLRDGVRFSRNEASSNAVLWPIAFTSKSLTNTDISYSTREREALGTLYGPKKFITVILPQHQCNYMPEATGGNPQERQDNSSLSHMLQECYCESISTTWEYYTHLYHNYSLQIGYTHTTRKQTETKKYQTCAFTSLQ